MAESPQDWLAERAHRQADRLRAQADNIKLIATFMTGIAAAMVATTLQVGEPVFQDACSAGLLSIAVSLTILIIGLDRIAEPNISELLEEAQAASWTPDDLLKEMKKADRQAFKITQWNIALMRWILWPQLIFNLLSGLVATLTLCNVILFGTTN